MTYFVGGSLDGQVFETALPIVEIIKRGLPSAPYSLYNTNKPSFDCYTYFRRVFNVPRKGNVTVYVEETVTWETLFPVLLQLPPDREAPDGL